MPIDRRLLRHFEWTLPLLVLVVSVAGVATVYSATYVPGSTGLSGFTWRQLASLALGLAGMVAVLAFDYRRLDRAAVLLYALALGLVLLVPVLGRVGGGSRRWIRIGPLSLQPAELMKLALVVFLARHFARLRDVRPGLREAVVPLVATAVPAVAILVQPDLGSAAVLGLLLLTMLVLGGLRLRVLGALDTPVPYSPPLEEFFLVSDAEIERAARLLAAY